MVMFLKQEKPQDYHEKNERKETYNPSVYSKWWEKLNEDAQREEMMSVLLDQAGVKGRVLITFRKRFKKLFFKNLQTEPRLLYDALDMKLRDVQSSWNGSGKRVKKRCLTLCGRVDDTEHIIQKVVMQTGDADRIIVLVDEMARYIDEYFTQPLQEYRKESNRIFKEQDRDGELFSLQMMRDTIMKNMENQYISILESFGKVRNTIKQMGVWRLVEEDMNNFFEKSKHIMELCHKLLVMSSINDKNEDGLSVEEQNDPRLPFEGSGY